MTMKSFLCLLLLTAHLALGFTPTPFSPAVGASSTMLFNKKYPAGRPNTVQADEDMAMWFEDEKGNAKKALSKPVGGRPVTTYTKQQVEEIEKKGVDPFEKVKAFGKFLMQKPKYGDKWLQ